MPFSTDQSVPGGKPVLTGGSRPILMSSFLEVLVSVYFVKITLLRKYHIKTFIFDEGFIFQMRLLISCYFFAREKFVVMAHKERSCCSVVGPDDMPPAI